MNIQEFRQQYPQYNDINDQDLAKSLHQKYYSDLPFDDFSNKFIGSTSTQTTPKISQGGAATTAFNTGVERFTHGVMQPLLESGNAVNPLLNLLPASAKGLANLYLKPAIDKSGINQAIAKGSQDFANKREQDYKEAESNYPITSTALSTVGGIGATIPTMLIPGGGQSNAARLITQGALQGGAAAGGQYVPEGSSRITNALTGGITGAGVGTAMQGGGYLLGKLLNATKGNFADDAAKEIVDLGNKYNVPVFASDAAQTRTLNAVAQGLEDVPIIGMTSDRATQMAAQQTAANKVVSQLEDEMLAASYGGNNGLKRLQETATSFGPRSDAAKKLLKQIDDSGDDWNRIIQTSGNVRLFRSKLIADKKYNKVSELADKYGDVSKTNTLNAIDNAVQSVKKSVLPDNSLLTKLETIKSNIKSKNLNYSAMREARSDISDLIDDFTSGKNSAVGAKGVNALQGIKKGIETDMDKFAQINGGELRTAWRNADSFYKRNVTPAKDLQLAKALTNVDADQVYSKFITRATKEGKATRFYNALDEKGRAAVRYGMANEAFEKAYDAERKMFSPATFATEFNKLNKSYGVFFKGQQKAETDGFLKLMRATERSKIALSKPETGVKNIPYLIGIGAGGAAVYAPMATALSAGGAVALKKLMTTDAGKKILLASSKLPAGSPALQNLADQAARFIQSGVAVSAAESNNQRNRNKGI